MFWKKWECKLRFIREMKRVLEEKVVQDAFDKGHETRFGRNGVQDAFDKGDETRSGRKGSARYV
ncbi:hypothetical protein [Ureibacillus aquaedulcis]|uniref:Uncharacterized protein n=1 Tax=Ureibacillus aquaedulcis TaxID=3058421 RepID=A0ABT8GSU3_9BACL|nr:hypothetical protein [Ureibacillus sp. BA0131]MDN4494294.1 hypothetical protein [Ureibacillus sp. BA0131]